MRYSAEHKQQTRQRIVEQASRSFRRNGIESVSIAALMAEAGLTHGGFYAHFDSKEELLVEAMEHALRESLSRLSGAGEGDDELSQQLSEILGAYLSLVHRDSPEQGCAIAAVGPEAVRTEDRCRDIFETAIEERVSILQRAHGGGRKHRANALATMSLMVGGIVLSRSVRDPELSKEILATARKAGERMAVTGTKRV